MNPIIPINRIEFQMACTSYVGSQNDATTTTTGGSTGTGTGNVRNIGIKNINTPIRDDGFIDDSPIRVFR